MAAAGRQWLERTIVAGWTRRGVWYWLCLPLSWLTCAVARRRIRARRTHDPRLAAPVIVVGNLIAGGAGKTPIVIALVQALRARGRNPGVIARGYAARDAAQPLRVDAASDPASAGDEPVLVAQRTGAPVAVFADRRAAALALLAAHPELDVIVSDDGLQHYGLARALECVVFDAHGAGNGACLPAGPLREPLDRRRDLTLFSGCPIDAALCANSPAHAVPIVAETLIQLATGQAIDARSHLQGRAVSAYAGIAHPHKFFASLQALGAQVEGHALPDHAHFDAHSFAQARHACIVITEKDAVKCARIPALANDPRIHVLRIDAKLDPALVDFVMEKLDGPQAA